MPCGQSRICALVPLAMVLAACETGVPLAPESIGADTELAAVERISEEFEFSLDLYLDCLDETVVWSGTGLFEDLIVETGTGTALENGKVSLIASTMVGPSGTWVDPLVVNHFNANNGQGNFLLNERITWKLEGADVKMDVWTVVRIVVTGGGEVLVLADTEGPTCELR
ncbi:MAG TPA: hypothetical protein VLA33_09090 [Gemmatimonadota bacterium]|nr:hypothetical protein [Gemmatimonadota bacterium]